MPIKHYSQIFFICIAGTYAATTHTLWIDDSFKSLDDLFQQQEQLFKSQREHMRSTFDTLMSFENKSSDAQPHIKITKNNSGIDFILDLKKFALSEKDITIDATEESVTVSAKTKDVETELIIQNKSNNILIAFALEQKKSSDKAQDSKDKESKTETTTNEEQSAFQQKSNELFYSEKKLDFSKTDARIDNNVLSLSIPFKQSEKIAIKINKGTGKIKTVEMK
ncbi:MAG: hypothetical protein UU47_C0018G0017 [candidate division TM6 bacterium GW2011_GWE2_41_16]|nr:MAG: hypothetical protein UU47_C0018G0017 [candidate division TM6 bacterium GW2011_GWE2_41_16]